MSANRKMILLVALGACACLLSFLLSQYFAKKTHIDQLLLTQVQSLAPRVEHLRRLSRNFMQNGDDAKWREITENLKSLSVDIASEAHGHRQWQKEIQALKTHLVDYRQLLNRIHDPAVALNAEKAKLQAIGLSFSEAVETRLIAPYRKEEGLRLYEGHQIDPFKNRIKDTAYDVMRLHLQQQLILMELLADWDLDGYQRKKEHISRALARHKTQLNYMNVLVGDAAGSEGVIASLEQKMDQLVHHEKIIIGHFTTLADLNGALIVSGNRLLQASEALTDKIIFDIASANRLNRGLSWGLLVFILGGLGIVGSLLTRDIIGFVRDLERSREELREKEQLLGNILESMNEGVFVLDREFKNRIYNRGMEAITNVPREAVMGRCPWEAFPHVKNSPIEKNIRSVMNGGAAVAMQVTHPRNPNVWSRDSFSPLKEADGRIVGVVGVLTDITRQKQDEEELKRLRNYLSNIIDSMPSIIVAVDSACKVTQWNHQTEKITGLRFDAVQSQPLTRVFPRLADKMDQITHASRDRQVIRAPKVSRQSGHDTRFEDITIFPLVTNGVAGAVIRVDDVTERVRMEEMMIQSEKMLSVGGLAAGMAHEINNPLAGILQNVEVLENRLRGDLPANHSAAEAAGTTLAAIRHYLALRKLPGMIENIRESGNRAADIVKNMLSFARKSDRMVSSQSLGSLLDRTLELVRTDYDMKKHYDVKQIRIVREYDPSAPPVPCEASKIQQVFMNILKNGAEAMGGVTEAPAPPTFVLRVRDDGDWIRVEIEDNGPGMDERTRRRIFEPFFTTKPVGQGTGLGLSVSYFIITEDHGGEMGVHAVDSGGTCFVIRLPKTGKR